MSSVNIRPVMIMAGGTGGHVYPALAVAEELMQHGIPVIWMGTKKGIEARLVPDAGIEIDWLGMSGLRGKGALTLLFAPLKIIVACYQALKILMNRKPAVVLGMGGFVSAPGGLMAWLMRVPLLIHEQNSVPGMSNRILAKLADRVLEAFPNSFKSPSTHVGNPVRKVIAELPLPEQRFAERTDALRVFVFGGSLGAARLNELVPQVCAELKDKKELLVKHQTGAGNFEQTQSNYMQLGIQADVFEYINDMAEMYAWADLVICRAGAMTIAELAAAGVASILVPYPHAVDDHQTHNARYLSEAGAGVLLQQKDLNVDSLVNAINSIDRNTALSMANKAKEKGMPEATRLVTEACLIAGGYDVN